MLLRHAAEVHEAALSRPYGPREDTYLLMRAVPARRLSRNRTLLEVGTGSGTIALRVAAAGTRVVATDIDRAALRHVRSLARERGFSVDLVRADLLRGLRKFDRILFNPPYLPTPAAARDPDFGTNRAIDGGPDGWSVATRFVDQLMPHLNPGGCAWLVVSSRQSAAGRRRVARAWRARGGRVRTAHSVRLADERLVLWRLEFPGLRVRRRRLSRGAPSG